MVDEIKQLPITDEQLQLAKLGELHEWVHREIARIMVIPHWLLRVRA